MFFWVFDLLLIFSSSFFCRRHIEMKIERELRSFKLEVAENFSQKVKKEKDVYQTPNNPPLFILIQSTVFIFNHSSKKIKKESKMF